MNKRLKAYLSKRGAKPLDPSVIKNYEKTMSESTIPQIVKDIERSERIAAELRFTPITKTRKKEN